MATASGSTKSDALNSVAACIRVRIDFRVVEDEEMVRRIVYESLRAHGYKVLEPGGPREGLQAASERKDPIHLLLTDVIMPGMNGSELSEKILEKQPDNHWGLKQYSFAFLLQPVKNSKNNVRNRY